MDVLELAMELIERPSITPDDAGCQDIISAHLERLGFEVEAMPFGPVQNLWARRGKDSPFLVFAGHTDVVPPGADELWLTEPFRAVQSEDGRLVGRGSADMKASLAAMICALERFVARHPEHGGSLGMLLTSDEEGAAVDGTVKVMEVLAKRGELFDFCVIGEPSSDTRLGDTVRLGRRGSLTGLLRILGTQGHVAYPLERENPIHAFGRLVTALTAKAVDAGNEHFPPTTFQMVNVHADADAPNVVPGDLRCRFNFRYSTEWTHESLISRVESTLKGLGIDYEIEWRLVGEPFLTKPGKLTETVAEVIEAVTGVRTELSTGGGTSDGRFIAPHGIDVVEIGPINATIHKVNEEVRIEDIRKLEEIYFGIAERLLL